MAQRPRQARSDGLRELLIAYREYRLPKSGPPPRWSAPAGRPDALLDALKAGEPVVLVSATLLCAMMAAGLPEAAYKRFAFGGLDWAKAFRLTERGELVELSDDEYDRPRDELPAG
jgi:hypothetical protein